MNKDIFGNKKRGATAILLTMLIITITLLIASGLSLIFIGQIKQSQLAGYTTSAFYAADAGAEYALFQIVKTINSVPGENYSENLNLEYNEATVFVEWTYRSVDSRGYFSDTNRKVQISW